MRITKKRILYVACAIAAMFSARAADAQPTHDVMFRVHRAGDTTAVRNAEITIDYEIKSEKTDAAGIVRVHDVPDNHHNVTVLAPGYAMLQDEFNSGEDVPQPIVLEMIPVAAGADAAKAKPPTPPKPR